MTQSGGRRGRCRETMRKEGIEGQRPPRFAFRHRLRKEAKDQQHGERKNKRGRRE
jgi:hypothetical protein